MDNDTAADRLYGPEPAAQPAGTTLLGGGLPAAPTNQANVADTLYGGKDLEEQQTGAAADHAPKDPPGSLEDSLYGGEEMAELPIPEEIKEARNADTARSLYSPQVTFGTVIPAAIFEGDAEIAKLSAGMQRAVVAEVREVVQDLGMTPDDVLALRTVGQRCNSPVTDATRQEWRAESTKRLTEIYGADAPNAYQDAMNFVRRDPRFAKAIEHGGRADHPDAVVLFAKLAKQAKASGIFK